MEGNADQHPNPGIPYIIAVDTLATDAILRAKTSSLGDDLFGQTVMIINRDTSKLEAARRSPEVPGRPDREKGFWLGRCGARNRHVSAILLVSEVMPWSVTKQTPVLWHNPWVLYPLSLELWRGPQMIVDAAAGAYTLRQGKSAAEVFGKEQ